MEFFGARSQQPIETCLEEVRRSDILVVILSHLYGTIVPGLSVSYSEAEYTEGHRLGKPCLVYMRNEDTPVLPVHVERDPDKLRLLEAWRTVLHSRHTIATFRDAHDLAVQVAADVGTTLRSLSEASRLGLEAAHDETPVNIVGELRLLVSRALELGVPESRLAATLRAGVSKLIDEVAPSRPSVFLSYSHRDEEIVAQVAERLTRAGVDIWRDVDRLTPGVSIAQEIDRALSSAQVIVFFISSASARSKWASAELGAIFSRQRAHEAGPVLLPVLLEKGDVPPLLRSIHWLDMTNGDIERGTRNLIAAIRHWRDARQAEYH